MPRRPDPTGLPVHVVVALVMTAAALFEAGYGGRGAGYTPVSVATALVTGLAVLLARWTPVGGVALLVVALGAPVLLTSDLPPAGGAQLIASMLLVGYAAYRLRSGPSLAAYAVAALVPALTLVLAGEAVWEFAFYALILGPAWLVGALLRREQRRSAELTRLTDELRAERERQAEVAVAAERTRISRELHDAVAHTVSVMTLQVGVVRRRLGDGVEADTLQGAETLGRQAVDELRRIVGLVREGEPAALSPLPSLTQLDELVGRVREAGADVRVRVRGDLGAVPQALDMSAYRILQEGLTNVLRHAPGASADVAVDAGPAGVSLDLANGPGTGPVRPGPPGGHGLPGMRERVHVLGGRLEAGPTSEGGFRVSAWLPGEASPDAGAGDAAGSSGKADSARPSGVGA